MHRACGWIFALFAGLSFFANNQLQSQYIEQAAQFIKADILFPAFDATQFFTTQSRPGRELLL